MGQIQQSWWDIKYWGVEKNMDFSTQKRIILSNQLSILLALVGLLYWGALWLAGESSPIERLFLVELFVFLLIPVLNKLHKISLTPLLVSVLFPIFTLLITIVSKKFYPTEVSVVQYFAPRFIILGATILPLVMLNPQKKRFFWIGLSVPFISLVLFDFWHWIFGVSHSQLNVYIPHYFVMNIASGVAFVLFTSAFLLLHRVTNRYEEQLKNLVLEVNQKNYNLITQQNEITEAYEELRVSQAAIQEQSEKIIMQQFAIERVNQELLEKNEILETHSNVLLRLARSRNVQLGNKHKALQEIVEVSFHALQLSRVSIWEYDVRQSKIICIAVFEQEPNENPPKELFLTDYPAYYNAIKRETIIKAEDVSLNIYTYELCQDYFHQYDIKSTLDTPYFVDGVLRGIVSFAQKKQHRTWSAEDINFITSVAETLTVIYETHARKKANQQIIQQKEEIEAQRDILHHNREKLLAAQEVIKAQNEQLKVYTLDLEKKVEQKARELLETSKDLENFTYRASHDLKGPLATLEGLCNAGLLEVQEPKSIQYFVMLRDTIRKMKGILDGLIKVMEIKELEPEISRVNLRTLIEETLAYLRKEQNFDETKISFVFPKAQLVNTDRDLLKIAITQVLHNALSYRISLKNYTPYIHIILSENETCWELLICDNGEGVHKTAFPYIFDMFYKGTKNSKGHGLGLYIARAAMQKLQGNIEYKPHPQETIFLLRIPKNLAESSF